MGNILVIFLIACLMLQRGDCNNNISILKNKGIEDCQNCNCTVRLPIKSLSIVKEFTFCGKYSFKFLKDSVLMYLNAPDTYIRIMDFTDKLGLILHDGGASFFFFPNQTLKPDSWQHVCLAVSNKALTLVLNGEVIFNNPPNSIMKEFLETDLSLGGENKPKRMYRRFEGIMTGAYLWNKSLSTGDLISITADRKSIQSISSHALFSWKTFNLPYRVSCLEYITLDANHEIFKDTFQEKQNILIEHKTTFDSSSYLCKAFGGELVVPQNDTDRIKLSKIIQQSEECSQAYIGLKKYEDHIVDLNGIQVKYERWDKNEPNGKEYEQCVYLAANSWYNDIKCSEKHCYACQMSTKNVYSLRGEISYKLDRYYFVSMTSKETKIRGLTKVECFWNKTWHFGAELTQDKSLARNYLPPVGLQSWNNGMKLKFTQCRKDEFTCHTYGHCISLDKRCDGQKDCIGII